MLVVTETRNKKVYITHTMTDWDKPIIRTLFYLTTSDPDVIPNGTRLQEWNGIYLAHLYERDIPVYVVNGKDALPEFSEELAFTKPRGRCVYERGEWRRK